MDPLYLPDLRLHSSATYTKLAAEKRLANVLLLCLVVGSFLLLLYRCYAWSSFLNKIMSKSCTRTDSLSHI